MNKNEKLPIEPSELEDEKNPHKRWLVSQMALLAASPRPRQTAIYKLLKGFLQPLGYWKERPRGKGFEPGNKVGPINSKKK